jgi:hypothetical protein
MARVASEAGIEVSLFARPGADWTPSAAARAPAGASLGGASHGAEGLVHCIEDIRRAAAYGIRSVLIADLGLLNVFSSLRASGHLPPEMQAKVSVMMPIANPATAKVLVALGASTLNVAVDLSLPELAAIRAAVDVPLDIYVEAPDSAGGFIRHYEVAEMIRLAAPVYLKFGLSNAANVYPSGGHLATNAVRMSQERVRRAKLALQILDRMDAAFVTSSPGAAGLAIPDPPRTQHPAPG